MPFLLKFQDFSKFLLSVNFCETLHNRRQAPKVSVALSISEENAGKGCNST